MSEAQSSNEETQPQTDPTIDKIDALSAKLALFRDVMVRTTNAADDAHEGRTYMFAVADAMHAKFERIKSSGERVSQSADLLEIVNRLRGAAEGAREARRDARIRTAVVRTVRRMWGALTPDEPTEQEILDRAARYVEARIAAMRASPKNFTAQAAVNDMIAGMGRKWPALGRRLERRRTKLENLFVQLAGAQRKGRPKDTEGGRKLNAKSADELREEILRCVAGKHVNADTIRKYRNRKVKQSNK